MKLALVVAVLGLLMTTAYAGNYTEAQVVEAINRAYDTGMATGAALYVLVEYDHGVSSRSEALQAVQETNAMIREFNLRNLILLGQNSWDAVIAVERPQLRTP